ncbi:ATP-binding response regulator [Duganella qianjiadongensis]|uniref:histidine kinase n=1 Tax=Duganella qianjiadongensis TaxID=2692176 RepID=A0ABW9VSR3_9BURK|nr:hybrid sensor histidine kinase/response regulator [Duganella qianjiadongensis]MYM42017.1 response regulator [Duganella qianjiadongensis]
MNHIGNAMHDQLTDVKVRMDLVEAMESVSIGGIIGTTNVAVLSAWLTRFNADFNWIIGWLLVKVLVSIYMVWVEICDRRTPVNTENVKSRLLKLALFPAVNGVLWGWGIFLMWEGGNTEIQLILMLFTVAMAAAALLELKQHLPAFFSFFIPSLLSFVTASLWYKDSNTVFVFLSGATFVVWSVRHALIENKRIIRNLYKKYEVIELTIKLQEQIKITESANHAKSRFIAAASHDLRQPMHALSLYLGALSNFDLPASARPVLDKVRECAKTMDDMFAALLDISRLDASSFVANFTTFSITAVLDKIQTEFSQQAAAKNLELRIAPCSAVVSCDAELLENILRNLVSNALRYTNQGKILIGCRRRKMGLSIGVYDTGIGIADDMQSAIFEEFVQVHNREFDRSQGLGLGLSIAQRQAKLMLSSLRLTSQFGRGSVFELPLKLSTEAPVLATHATRVSSSHYNIAGMLIVVVDDESIILDAANLILTQWGCEVITAQSGSEALSKLSTSHRVPHALVCDHHLRADESGIQVIEAIRNEFSSDIPAVLVSGDTSPEQMQIIASAGFPVMHKPIQSQELYDLLQGLIFNSDLRVE